MSERQESGGEFVAFLLGGILGAAAGLLLAPRTGKETRRRLKSWTDDMEEKGQALIDEGKDLLDQGKQIIQEKLEKMKREPGRKVVENED